MSKTRANPFRLKQINVGDKVVFAGAEFKIEQIWKDGDQEGTVVLQRVGSTPCAGNTVNMSESMVRDIVTRPGHYR